MEKYTVTGVMNYKDIQSYTTDLRQYLDFLPTPEDLLKEQKSAKFNKIVKIIKILVFLFFMGFVICGYVFSLQFTSVNDLLKGSNLMSFAMFLALCIPVYLALFHLKYELHIKGIYKYIISNDGYSLEHHKAVYSVSWAKINKIKLLKTCVIFEIDEEIRVRCEFIPIRFFKDGIEIDKLISYCEHKIKGQGRSI